MVNQINQGNFGGRGLVTCYTCHRASDRPGSRSRASSISTASPKMIRTGWK